MVAVGDEVSSGGARQPTCGSGLIDAGWRIPVSPRELLLPSVSAPGQPHSTNLGRLGGRQPAETHHRHIRAMLSGNALCARMGLLCSIIRPEWLQASERMPAGFACRLGSTVPERTVLAGSGAQMVQNRLDALLERSAYGQHRKLGMLGEDRREDLLGPGPGV